MYKRICIKFGSNVLTGNKGMLDYQLMGHLVEQIVYLMNTGTEIVLVTSGAIAAGKQIFNKPNLHDSILKRQLWASLGQVKLMDIYSDLFQKHQLLCSQVLVTKSDFRDRDHYLNMKNCISALLSCNIIPVINENDVVSVTELMFTDNDELAGLIAAMMDAEALILLSNVDGIFNADPHAPGSKIISQIGQDKPDLKEYISDEKSDFGRGGMMTKAKIARKVASSGITVYIANGLKTNIIIDLLKDDSVVLNTKFLSGRKSSNVKKWIAHSEGFEKGEVFVNKGARVALLSNKATSLLYVGITKIAGKFEKGDIVKIYDENKSTIGLGIARQDSETAKQNIGRENIKPFIHYDYLYLHNE